MLDLFGSYCVFFLTAALFDNYYYNTTAIYNIIKYSYPILVTELSKSSPWQFAAIIFGQACSHLPRRRMALSFNQYQVILLGDRHIGVNNLPKVVMQLSLNEKSKL